jgi:glycosyltransferase involved in cell wall biosynthesis
VESYLVAPVDRAALGIPPDRAVVGIVGRLEPAKGQHRLLHALRLLHDAGRDVHVLLVGGTAHGLSAGYEPELRALVHQLGVEHLVTMTGHVPDVRPYVAIMDVLVSASEMEAFGIVLLEALIQGVPVVAVGDAGPREIVAPGVNGVLVDRPDPPLLADAVGDLLRDHARRRRMALASRQSAVERFGVQAMTRGLERELRTVAAKARAA